MSIQSYFTCPKLLKIGASLEVNEVIYLLNENQFQLHHLAFCSEVKAKYQCSYKLEHWIAPNWSSWPNSIEGNDVEQKTRVESVRGVPKVVILKNILATPNEILKMMTWDLEAGKVGIGCLLQLMMREQHVSIPIGSGQGHEKVINYG